MARIRTIKPDFWTDERVVELDPWARLLFIGLLNFCDDAGRMECSPKRIKMQVFPADPADISKLLAEIGGEGMITLYTIENIEYLQINNFTKHQKIDARFESKIPPPPDPAKNSLGMEGNGREWKGMEGKKKKPSVSKKISGSGSRTKAKTPAPDSFEIDDGLKEWLAKKRVSLKVAEAKAEEWLIHHRAEGSKFTDWRASFQKWINNGIAWEKIIPDPDPDAEPEEEYFPL